MKRPLQRHELVIKEYEEAFEAYLAVCPAVRNVNGARISFDALNSRQIQKAQQRLAMAERELIELDAA